MEGAKVTINDSDCAAMYEQRAISLISDTLFHIDEKKRKINNNGEKNSKKSRTGSSSTVDTRFGENGLMALYHTSNRDKRQSKDSQEKKKRSLESERTRINTTLTALDVYKKKCEKAAANHCQAGVVAGAPPLNYWEVSERSSDADITLFLRLFAPDCKALSKKKEEKWTILQQRVRARMTQVEVDAQQQKLSRQLASIEAELNSLCPNVQDSVANGTDNSNNNSGSTAMNTEQ